MLHIHGIQRLYPLSDTAMEDAPYGIESMRRFAGLRISDKHPQLSPLPLSDTRLAGVCLTPPNHTGHHRV